MTQLHLDIPNNFNVATYTDHEEVRRTFENIIDVALQLELELSTRRAPAYLDNEAIRLEETKGIFYAYHARVKGRHSYCIKGGPLTDLWYFDAKGYSGWCTLARDSQLQEASASYNLDAADQTINEYRQRFLQDGFSRQKQDETELVPEIQALDDFIFYPLQLEFDQVLKLSKFSQPEIVDRLIHLAEQHERSIVIKRHPICKSVATERVLEKIGAHPHVHLSDASIHKLIPVCSKVLVSNSGVGLQALIHGKPVCTLAPSEYRHMTGPIDTLDDLGKIFTASPSSQSERIRRQLGYLLNEFLVDTRDRSAVEKRIALHVKRLGIKRPTPKAQTTNTLSILHRAKQELKETIALLLLDFGNLEGTRRQEVSQILLRAARKGLQLKGIIAGTDLDFWKVLAVQLMNSGELEKAESLAKRMLTEEPEDSTCQLVYGQILTRQGEPEEGLRWAQSAVKSDGTNVAALVFVGRRLASVGSLEEALGFASDAVELEPRHPIANWIIAKIHFQKGDVKAALKASEIAVSERPETPSIKSLHEQILAAYELHGQSS